MNRVAKFEKVSKMRFVEDWIDTFGGEVFDAEQVYERVKLPRRATKGSAQTDVPVAGIAHQYRSGQKGGQDGKQPGIDPTVAEHPQKNLQHQRIARWMNVGRRRPPQSAPRQTALRKAEKLVEPDVAVSGEKYEQRQPQQRSGGDDGKSQPLAI